MASARSLSKVLNLSKTFHCIRIQSLGISGLAPRSGAAFSERCAQCSLVRGCPSSQKSDIQLPCIPWYGVQQQRHFTDAVTKKALFSRIAEKIGFKGKMRYKRGTLQRSGIRMYLCAVELVDYSEFFDELNLPDTFNSWFRITELHMWMCTLRLTPEGREGTLVRNNMVKNLWDDVDKRTKKLGELVSSSGRREGILQLSQEFRANLYSYDEGMLSDDKVLAGAVWRSFFEMNCDDAEQLEKMVHYIRKQVSHIESQTADRVVGNGIVTFLPFNGDKLDLDRTKPILGEILNRS